MLPYHLHLPKRTDRHTYMAVFYGVILFVWLSSESNNVLLVILLGLGLTLGITALALLHQFGGKILPLKIWFPAFIALGALIGLGTVASTFLLMLMKNVQHSHLYLDFPTEVTVELWQRTPAWILAGALLGGAVGLALIAIKSPPHI